MQIDRGCEWCGGALVATPGRGRPRKYCRPSHRQRAYEARKAAARYRLDVEDVVISREGWETMRSALTELAQISEGLAVRLDSGKAPSQEYLRSVARLTAAVAELQRRIEPTAAW